MKVLFSDFYTGFAKDNNIIVNSLRSIYEERVDVTLNISEADIIFASMFGSEHKKIFAEHKDKTILWLGENQRPRSFNSKYSITTDIFTDNNNFRLPLWYLEIDWHNTGLGVAKYKEFVEKLWMRGTYEVEQVSDKEFCIAIFNNPEGTRVMMLEALQALGKVKCYGKPFGNWFSTEETYKDKMAKMNGYAFNLCTENSFYPGYYTEKCVHAKLAGVIPIYMADPLLRLDFRSQSMLNIYDFDSAKSLALEASRIFQNKQMLCNMLNEPLLTQKPSLKLFYKWLLNKTSNILAGR